MPGPRTRRSLRQPNAGVDGCDQAIQLAEKAFHTAYTLRFCASRTESSENHRSDRSDNSRRLAMLRSCSGEMPLFLTMVEPGSGELWMIDSRVRDLS